MPVLAVRRSTAWCGWGQQGRQQGEHTLQTHFTGAAAVGPTEGARPTPRLPRAHVRRTPPPPRSAGGALQGGQHQLGGFMCGGASDWRRVAAARGPPFGRGGRGGGARGPEPCSPGAANCLRAIALRRASGSNSCLLRNRRAAGAAAPAPRRPSSRAATSVACDIVARAQAPLPVDRRAMGAQTRLARAVTGSGAQQAQRAAKVCLCPATPSGHC